MNDRDLRRRLANRALLTVVGCTVLLTAGFVGVVALSSGDAGGLGGRVPFYVLALSVAFLAALWKLDDRRRDGRYSSPPRASPSARGF